MLLSGVGELGQAFPRFDRRGSLLSSHRRVRTRRLRAPGFSVALDDDRTVLAYRAMRVSSRDSPQSWSSGRIVTRAVQISE